MFTKQIAPLVEPARFKTAVRNGELELRYQPEVDLRTGEITALEALVRWTCPGVGPVQPREFLPLAEIYGLMPAIDTWVLETGAAQAAVWRGEYGRDRLLWLNISIESLLDDAFVYRAVTVLDRYQAPASELGFEISERVIYELGDEAPELLADLRELGFSLVVDDFTSFDSALQTIAGLPVDAVKLSPQFLRGGEQSVGAVIARAHEQGMYVVAEGVESADDAYRLTELGCDRAHGYLYGSAQRPDRAAWLLEHGAGWRGEPLRPPAVTSAGPRPQ